jgi:hypothetical protein
MTAPAATDITEATVRPTSAPAPGKMPRAPFEPPVDDADEPDAPLEPEEPEPAPPVAPPLELPVGVAEAPAEPEPAEPDAPAAPVTAATMPFEIVETVLQLDDDGVEAALSGVTVVPTV